MEGKISTLFRFAEYWLMCEPGRLKGIYAKCNDRLDVYDKRQLYSVGIPARYLNTKEELKEYIIGLGMMYIEVKKDSSFRVFNKLKIKKL